MKLIENGIKGTTASRTINKKSQVIASGVFNGGNVVIELEADNLRKAVVYQFFEPGGIVVDAKKNTTLIATVNAGGPLISIDVSVKQ